MKTFGYKNHKTFKRVMTPQNEEEQKAAELFAAFFAGYVIPAYMNNHYEPYGLIDGEMWFIDTDTGELTDYDDLWAMCKFAAEIVNGEDDGDDDPEFVHFTQHWCVEDEPIMI